MEFIFIFDFWISDKRIDSKVSFKKKKKKRIDTKWNEVVQRAQVISYLSNSFSIYNNKTPTDTLKDSWIPNCLLEYKKIVLNFWMAPLVVPEK